MSEHSPSSPISDISVHGFHYCLLETTSPRRPALGVSESWLAKAEPGNNRGTPAAVEPEKFHSDFPMLNRVTIGALLLQNLKSFSQILMILIFIIIK